MTELNKDYWENRYLQSQTGWDAGEITTPLKNYVDQLTDKNIRILIPGAGNAHEAEYLFKNGFKNVTVLDIAEQPLQNIKNRVPDFPDANLVLGDFFKHETRYDLILEQTFFCALDPSFRQAYAEKMASLLNPKGRLVGVLFNTQFEGGPPFGGSKSEYEEYFQPFFRFVVFDDCYNSIKPRENRELFIILEKNS